MFDNMIPVLSSTDASGGKLVVCWNREALTISDWKKLFFYVKVNLDTKKQAVVLWLFDDLGPP